MADAKPGRPMKPSIGPNCASSMSAPELVPSPRRLATSSSGVGVAEVTQSATTLQRRSTSSSIGSGVARRHAERGGVDCDVEPAVGRVVAHRQGRETVGELPSQRLGLAGRSIRQADRTASRACERERDCRRGASGTDQQAIGADDRMALFAQAAYQAVAVERRPDEPARRRAPDDVDRAGKPGNGRQLVECRRSGRLVRHRDEGAGEVVPSPQRRQDRPERFGADVQRHHGVVRGDAAALQQRVYDRG